MQFPLLKECLALPNNGIAKDKVSRVSRTLVCSMHVITSNGTIKHILYRNLSSDTGKTETYQDASALHTGSNNLSIGPQLYILESI